MDARRRKTMKLFDFLKFIIDRFDGESAVSTRLDTLIAQQQQANQTLGAIMPRMEDIQNQGQQHTAQLRKVVDEVSGMASQLKTLQEQGDAKIAEAVAAARAQDQAALDTKLTELQGIQSEQSELINRIDALNPDAPPAPPNPNPDTSPNPNPTPNPPAEPPV
jgi:chromosome segregation ATPase